MKKEGIIRVYAGLSMDKRMIQADFRLVTDWVGWSADQRSRIQEEYRGTYFCADPDFQVKYFQDVRHSYALRYKLFSPDPSEDSMREQMQKEGYRSATMVEALALYARIWSSPNIFLPDEVSRSEDVFTGIGRHLIHRGTENYSGEEYADVDQYCTGQVTYQRTHIEKTSLFLGVKGH